MQLEKVDWSVYITSSVCFMILISFLSIGALYLVFWHNDKDILEKRHAGSGVLITLLVASIVTTLAACFLPNYFMQGSVIPTGFLNHYPGGVCGLGVVTGILLCFLFLGEIIMVGLDRTNGLKKYWGWFFGVIMMYFIGQLVLNSKLDYTRRRQQWSDYRGIGLFEYMIPTYLLQGMYFTFLLVAVETG